MLAGFYVEDDGRVNPVDATMALAAGFKSMGGRVVEGARVRRPARLFFFLLLGRTRAGFCLGRLSSLETGRVAAAGGADADGAAAGGTAARRSRTC